MRTKQTSSLADVRDLGINGIGSIPSVCRKESGKIVGDISGVALSTLGLISKRLYLFPFQTSRQIKCNKFRISVTNSVSNSNCSIGIYGNTKLSDNSDNPSNLLDFVDNILTNTTGDKETVIDFNFNKDLLYWIGIVCSSGPTLRALTPSSIFPYLGRVANSTSPYTHLYKNLTNSILPSVAPTDLIISTGNIPAIYILE